MAPGRAAGDVRPDTEGGGKLGPAALFPPTGVHLTPRAVTMT